MFKCNTCEYYGNEISAGLVNHCFNENLTEEEHEQYRNKGIGECPYFEKSDGNEDYIQSDLSDE